MNESPSKLDCKRYLMATNISLEKAYKALKKIPFDVNKKVTKEVTKKNILNRFFCDLKTNFKCSKIFQLPFQLRNLSSHTFFSFILSLDIWNRLQDNLDDDI